MGEYGRLPVRKDILKGDYVHIDNDLFSPGFLGVVLDDYRNRPARFCQVYGLFREAGSVYAYQLTKLDTDKDGFKKYLAALHESIIEIAGRPPDWETTDFDKDPILRSIL